MQIFCNLQTFLTLVRRNITIKKNYILHIHHNQSLCYRTKINWNMNSDIWKKKIINSIISVGLYLIPKIQGFVSLYLAKLNKHWYCLKKKCSIEMQASEFLCGFISCFWRTILRFPEALIVRYEEINNCLSLKVGHWSNVLHSSSVPEGDIL